MKQPKSNTDLIAKSNEKQNIKASATNKKTLKKLSVDLNMRESQVAELKTQMEQEKPAEITLRLNSKGEYVVSASNHKDSFDYSRRSGSIGSYQRSNNETSYSQKENNRFESGYSHQRKFEFKVKIKSKSRMWMILLSLREETFVTHSQMTITTILPIMKLCPFSKILCQRRRIDFLMTKRKVISLNLTENYFDICFLC